MKFDKPNFTKPWKIALEEHFAIVETVGYSQVYGKGFWQKLSANLRDLNQQRLEQMDKTGIELSVLSLNSPGIKELGFVGALVNGYSQIGGRDSCIYLDLPQYRTF